MLVVVSDEDVYLCDASFGASAARPPALLGREAEDSMVAFVLSRAPYTEYVFSYPASLIQPHPYLSSHYSFFMKTFCFRQPYSS